MPYEPFSMKEWNTCSVGLSYILKSLDSSASWREFIIECVLEARVTLHVPAALRRQQLHRRIERRCKTKPWGCWCAPRRPAHTLRPGWCGNHLHVPQPETRWRCTKQLFYLCTTANKLRLEFSRMREGTSFVLWHCCLSLHNALADHDSYSIVMKFHLMLLLSGSVLYHKIFKVSLPNGYKRTRGISIWF